MPLSKVRTQRAMKQHMVSTTKRRPGDMRFQASPTVAIRNNMNVLPVSMP
jgi:hypothetical protein